MTWIRIDDGFPTHPKISGLSDRAFRLHIAALCYCGMYLTDGQIPSKIVPKLGIAESHKVLKNLVKSGLWIKTDGGYQIHDYLKHQTSKVQAEQEKEANRIRAQKARERKSAQSHAVTNAVTVKNSTGGVTVAHTPTPTPTHKNKDIVQMEFERLWIIYPRKQGKAKAKIAFEKALQKTTIDVILEAVEKYAKTVNDPQFTAMPATWLNGERWNDEALATANITPKSLPHIRIEDQNGPYCQGCNQTWPCLTESKKGQAQF